MFTYGFIDLISEYVYFIIVQFTFLFIFDLVISSSVISVVFGFSTFN